MYDEGLATLDQGHWPSRKIISPWSFVINAFMSPCKEVAVVESIGLSPEAIVVGTNSGPLVLVSWSFFIV